jgi:hypothetical protein
MSTFSFSKVAIIESLEPDEFESGTVLSQYINGLRDDNPDAPPAELTQVEGCNGFLAKIHELTLAAQNDGDFPILHIEMHGWRDKSGLAFPDGSSLSWNHLADALASLNKAMHFNLVVCISACFGGHFVGSINPMASAPCFALIGPTHKANGPELLGSFRGFYRELLTTLNTPAALEALYGHRLDQGGFVTTSAEDWFFKLANGYLLRDCTPSRLKERVDKIIVELNQEGKAVSAEQRIEFENIGETMAMGFLDRMFPRFFMIDSIPENAQRFENSLSKAKADALNFFHAHGPKATASPAGE